MFLGVQGIMSSGLVLFCYCFVPGVEFAGQLRWTDMYLQLPERPFLYCRIALEVSRGRGLALPGKEL